MQALARRLEIHDDSPHIEVTSGHGRAIDETARRASAAHRFLRRAWFEAGRGERPRTISGRRADGSPFAALPVVALGPAMLGLSMVPGSYWPFRSAVIAGDARQEELRALIADPAARNALGQAWRLGPVYAEDEAMRRLSAAAVAEGWTRLERSMGTAFVMDLPALRAAGAWPRASAARKVAKLERQMLGEGSLRYRFVSGEAWADADLDAMAAIEAASWVGQRTDGSGAKFLRPEQRTYWERALADAELASMLSAAILFVGERPIAFSFDLNVGTLQYGIAGSYDAAFARWSPGRVLTWRHIEESEARGIQRIDWGSGDSGYKRQFGAVPGSPIVDLLFVRSRSLSAILRARWCRPGSSEAESEDTPLLTRREQLLIAALATAAAAASLAE